MTMLPLTRTDSSPDQPTLNGAQWLCRCRLCDWGRWSFHACCCWSFERLSLWLGNRGWSRSWSRPFQSLATCSYFWRSCFLHFLFLDLDLDGVILAARSDFTVTACHSNHFQRWLCVPSPQRTVAATVRVSEPCSWSKNSWLVVGPLGMTCCRLIDCLMD